MIEGRLKMGVFSKIHRFREAGEETNINNEERFGKPARSLFTSTKVMTVHHRIEITDESSNVMLVLIKAPMHGSTM